ncbi:MAG: hypothetical protein UU71_C0018G0007 [Parcubacteria group bacterium GW2011_GWB1_41_6]|nr:MAG: hypothetical protein UU71_C0018G0007 [Parcubacteria group bacterium GW2011_GWB1_41_6]KKS33406.1 MAG: hypothetical protein UU96_C0025G0006 [Parcubacteria group bacterium GW2011_GWC2_42_13]KKS55889.1 MAG: hypothetical protein UV22_C0039G0006 [Parcubacteria group bacterium GW2011_GWA2_42_35]
MATHRIKKIYEVSFEIEGFANQTFSRVVSAKSKKDAHRKFLKQEKKTKAVTAIKELK